MSAILTSIQPSSRRFNTHILYTTFGVQIVVFNASARYLNAALMMDDVSVADVVSQAGTPVYVYSLKRVLHNFRRLKRAFAPVDAQIHYSVKANGNLDILRALTRAGAGMDVVSGGEIFRALHAGANPKRIVFAGVGKSRAEIKYALEQGIGWFNVENALELAYINTIAASLGIPSVRVALRFNPQVTANAHPYMATGHGGAKFGLTGQALRDILAAAEQYPHIDFVGVHIHIGSQLGDSQATLRAIEKLNKLIQPYPRIHTINLGGGLPVAYQRGEDIPSIDDFAAALTPHLKGRQVLIEPGRSIVADAGLLAAEVQYVKRQAGQTFYIVDASMTELIRPALYQAHHEIVPLTQSTEKPIISQIVGPVCETADVLASDRALPPLRTGDRIALMTAGAYGMVMSSNYNARPRPPEVVIDADGQSWAISRRRESLDDLLRYER